MKKTNKKTNKQLQQPYHIKEIIPFFFFLQHKLWKECGLHGWKARRVSFEKLGPLSFCDTRQPAYDLCGFYLLGHLASFPYLIISLCCSLLQCLMEVMEYRNHHRVFNDLFIKLIYKYLVSIFFMPGIVIYQGYCSQKTNITPVHTTLIFQGY